MSTVQRLIRASQAVTLLAEIRFKGIPDREDWVVCQVLAGSVILAESAAGPVDDVMQDVIGRLEKMSQRIHLAAVKPEDEEG
jgi:hypothetical protein